jgi:hypothetical protein
MCGTLTTAASYENGRGLLENLKGTSGEGIGDKCTEQGG